MRSGIAMLAAGKAKLRKRRPVKDVSEKGLEFIARFEGCPRNPDGTLRVYNDPAGYATVGIGHLLHESNFTGKDVADWHGKTYKDALRLLRRDAARFVAAVNALEVKLTQNEMDALVSFAFNCGPHSLNGGVAAGLRRGDKHAAMVTLRQYDHAGGRRLPGLTARRTAEANLFLHGVYGS